VEPVCRNCPEPCLLLGADALSGDGWRPALGLRGLSLEACWGLVPLPNLGGRPADIPDFLHTHPDITSKVHDFLPYVRGSELLIGNSIESKATGHN